MKKLDIEHKQVFFLSVGIFLLSIFLRFWQLGKIPVGLYWDETAIFIDAKTISQTLKDMHGDSAFQTIFLSYGDYKLPMYIWLASLSFKLLGSSEFTLRLPSAVVGVLQGLVVFILLRELTQRRLTDKMSWRVSLLGWFIVAISPWSILFSRTGFEGYTGQFLVTTAVLCLMLSLKSKKWLIGSVLLAIAGVYSYYSVRFVWPVLVICFWFCFVSIEKWSLWRKPLNLVKNLFLSSLPYLVCLVIWGIGLIPIFSSPYYAASQQFRLSASSILDPTPYNIQSNALRDVTGNNTVSRVLYHGWLLQIQSLLENYSDHFDLSFLFLTGDPNLRHSTGEHGLFLLFSLPLLVSGIYYGVKKQPNVLVFLSIWWLIALLPASVPTDTPHALRSLNALTPIILLMAIGAVPFVNCFHSLKKQRTKQAVLYAVILLVSYQLIMFVVDYFYVYPVKSAMWWQQGYKDIVLTVDQNRNKYDKIWINIEDDRFFLWYLAYGDLTVQEIQVAMQHELILKSWENIEYKAYPKDRYPTAVKPFIIVTRAGSLEFEPTHKKIINDSYGLPKFEVGFYE
ncbi:MAG: glycosyltransferase family 39 protein [Patescibacteria group bacterium]